MKRTNDKVFLDSNICLYLISEDSPKKQVAEVLLGLPNPVISSQVLSETINVGIKKLKLSQPALLAHINFLMSSCELLIVSVPLEMKAIDLHFRFQYSYYDSLIIATALEAGCSTIHRRPTPRANY